MLEVFKIVFENNKKMLVYVKGILRNWCSKKLKDFSGGKFVMGSLERRKCMLSSVF